MHKTVLFSVLFSPFILWCRICCHMLEQSLVSRSCFLACPPETLSFQVVFSAGKFFIYEWKWIPAEPLPGPAAPMGQARWLPPRSQQLPQNLAEPGILHDVQRYVFSGTWKFRGRLRPPFCRGPSELEPSCSLFCNLPLSFQSPMPGRFKECVQGYVWAGNVVDYGISPTTASYSVQLFFLLLNLFFIFGV